MSRRPVAGLCLALAVVAAAAVAPANAQTPEAAFVTIEPVITSSREMLFGVAFTDASHGYAVGAYGRMLVTTDGGATWREQPSGVDARVPGSESGGQACLAPDGLPCTNVIFDVTFADPQHGWMVTESSVRATSDGGATWAEQRVPSVDSIPGAGPGPVGTSERPSSWSFRAVGFSDRQNGTVVGLGGTILSTTDGGATWQWQGDRSYGHLRSVSLPDRQHGQAVSPGGQAQQPYVTLATDNAGASWQMVRADLGPNVQTDEFAAVAFTDAQHGFVGGNGGRIFATSDGG
ncbi:MAG: YCF48-related protein, partial [Acidimicrobiales bacterium]